MLKRVGNMNDNNWEEYKVDPSTPLVIVLEIIDDAQCHGFEFKIQDGKIYSRQCP